MAEILRWCGVTASHYRRKTPKRKARTIQDRSGRQTPSNGLTVTDTTTAPTGIVGMRWLNDFRDGGSVPEHNGAILCFD
jgi:hypothetical protein